MDSSITPRCVGVIKPPLKVPAVANCNALLASRMAARSKSNQASSEAQVRRARPDTSSLPSIVSVCIEDPPNCELFGLAWFLSADLPASGLATLRHGLRKLFAALLLYTLQHARRRRLLLASWCDMKAEPGVKFTLCIILNKGGQLTEVPYGHLWTRCQPRTESLSGQSSVPIEMHMLRNHSLSSQHRHAKAL